MTKRDIVLIPYWIQEALGRAQLPLAACLEFPKIRTLLSASDLMGFASLQSQGDMFFSAGGAANEPQPSILCDMLTSYWRDSCAEQDAASRDYLNKTVVPMSMDAAVQTDLYARLFDDASRLERYSQAFSTYDLKPEVCGVVIYPGFFGKHKIREQEVPFVEALLKTLYVYDTYSEVAKTPLFRHYLDLLQA